MYSWVLFLGLMFASLFGLLEVIAYFLFVLCHQIPLEQTGSLPDPFNDISCGGWEITEEPRGRISLWAVSLQGRVCIYTFIKQDLKKIIASYIRLIVQSCEKVFA